jgi:hypothetical protein
LIPSFFQTDEVLEAYEVERERIKIDAFGKKLISDTLHEKGEIHDVYMRYLDLYKDIPEIKKQAR